MTEVARSSLGRGLLALAVALAFLWGAAAKLAAQPAGGALTQARAAYDSRSYQQVVDLLGKSLYPRSKFTTEAEEVEAYKLLGISYYWLSVLAKSAPARVRLEKQAERQYGALLGLRPRFRLKKLQHPDHVLKFFAAVVTKLKAASSPLKALEAELEHCRKKNGLVMTQFSAYRSKCTTKLVVTEKVVKRYFFWNFVPFGAGQFQNGQPLKGTLFAVGQGAMLLMNITALIIGETSYVRNGPDRTVRRDSDSQSRAADIQKLTIASGALFWSLVVWGVIDAIANYKKSSVVKQRQLIPIGGSNVGLSPSVSKDALTLGVTGRF
ncbi:MAG: hypothetical protein ABI333_07005 [bacterium]